MTNAKGQSERRSQVATRASNDYHKCDKVQLSNGLPKRPGPGGHLDLFVMFFLQILKYYQRYL